jgi:ABC-type transport system substrate-binding protein
MKVWPARESAIDRNAIIQAIEKGYAPFANSAIVPAPKTHYDPSLESRQLYDSGQASLLSEQPGWSPRADCVLTKDGQPPPSRWMSASRKYEVAIHVRDKQ